MTVAEVVGVVPYAVQLAGTVLPADQLGPVSVRRGRTDTASQPAPALCSFTVYTAALAQLPGIGDPVEVDLTDGALGWAGLTGAAADAARPRFRGTVTDVRARPDRVSSPATVTVTAVSRRAQLGRAVVGAAPWPQQLDGARAAAILAAAVDEGVPITTRPGDPGTFQVLARDVDAQPALTLLDELAVSTDSVLAEYRDGSVAWHDAGHRNTREPDVTLTADDVLADVEAVQQLAGVLNVLRLTYGVPPAGSSERPQLVYVSDGSVEAYGPFSASLTSQLVTADDALDFARRFVGRRALPYWLLGELVVDVTRTVEPTTAGQLLALEFGDLIAVDGFPPTGPFATARLWVEGWTETLTRHGWTFQLNVSDYGRSGTEPRWVDVDPDVSWAESAPVTWEQAVGWDSYTHQPQ